LAREKFLDQVAKTAADAFAVTGDISDGNNLEHDIRRICNHIGKPTFLLLGNHDRYHTSFAAAEMMVERGIASNPHVHRLTGEELVELSANTALVGVDGWADGTSGAGPASNVVLNDSILIRDLALLPKSLQWLKMQELAQGYTATIAPVLRMAMAHYKNVIVLTHVPPMPEATWHEGKTSDAEYLPHFCNETLGSLLREASCDFPTAKVTVLCGHTHSVGTHREGNLTVFTAPAEYHSPCVERVIPVE